MYVEEMIFLILQFSNIKTSGKAHFDQLVMARFNNEEILNSVGLPSQLLQQIKNKENKGDYDDDESEDRFTKFENIRGTKRKSKPISRKRQKKTRKGIEETKENKERYSSSKGST